MTVIELEFDTGARDGAPLGDIAASLVSVDELLRDLATIAGSLSGPEFREIQVAAITMRTPLKVTLSLRAIPDEAVTAFQDICREIIVTRGGSQRRTVIDGALARCAAQGDHSRITEAESRRIYDHIQTLHAAAVPLKGVSVRGSGLNQ